MLSRRLSILLALAASGIAADLPAASPGFRYDPASGRCRNAAGEEGRNKLAIEQIRASKSAECADLRGVQLLPPSTGDLQGWNLRGADLTEAELFFSALADADLCGADLSRFKFGYVRITGVVDAFTKLPPTCAPEGGRIDCSR